MAQRILAIDLGAHSVKLAEAVVGFRSSKLVRVTTVPVPPGPEPPLERALVALDAAVLPSALDGVVVGVPGDLVLMRLLDIPFADVKRAFAIVGNELADDIPWELEEAVFDHALLPPPTSKVLAAVARSADVRMLLDRLSSRGIDPRALLVAPVSYAPLVRRIDPTGAVLVVDLGHHRTNVAIVAGGRTLAARTLSRAGHQVTEEFRRTFQLTYPEAEELKEREALLLADEQDPGDEPSASTSRATARALAPLLRELRFTHGQLASRAGVRIDRALLCGGTSLLRGLDAALERELALPVQRLDLGEAKDLERPGLGAEGQAVSTLSVAMCLEQGARPGLDLRQGEFAYRADTSVFKDKLVTLAMSMATILIFAALNAYMSLYALRAEEKALRQELKHVTQDVFGESISSPRNASKMVLKGSKPSGAAIPSTTAFDILNYISTGIPGADKVKLDFTLFSIKPTKTNITGTADSRSAIGDIVKALQKNSCFQKIASGTISDVAEGKKQFSLTIDTECF
jgi:Tfp pilus assembly PilM family ATPase